MLAVYPRPRWLDGIDPTRLAPTTWIPTHAPAPRLLRPSIVCSDIFGQQGALRARRYSPPTTPGEPHPRGSRPRPLFTRRRIARAHTATRTPPGGTLERDTKTPTAIPVHSPSDCAGTQRHAHSSWWVSAASDQDADRDPGSLAVGLPGHKPPPALLLVGLRRVRPRRPPLSRQGLSPRDLASHRATP